MHVFNGLSFFFSKQMCLFVYLLLIMLKLKGEAINTTSFDNYNVSDSIPIPAPQIKYDVFVNFRGEIRNDFLAHLRKAFKRKHIFYFIDDDELSRGEEISKSLPEAIETSFISLVIFSKNYASSKWCLDELVKIIQCRQKYGQIVLPIFYQVDPSDVRNQMGTYENAFVEHEKEYDFTRVLAWRFALKKSANISGYHSSNFLNDAELIEEIVKCLLGRLDHVLKLNTKGLIGIGKQISHVESLLQVHLKEVRAIGLWGMGGIGKTTIAKEVYNRLCLEYDRCYFMDNVREELARYGVTFLQERLFSTLLREQELKIDTPHGLPSFVERRLRRMKVLVVLDDVNDREQLDFLTGALDWFGAGSRIIITTRDKQVVSNTVVDVYEVRPLDFNESFQLFNLNAYEKNHHVEMEYYELSKGMVNYSKGIPLVLKVLGQLLCGKKKKIWETQLKRLKKVPVKKVHDVILLSCNDLQRDEKEIFLDIACFFDGLHLKVDDMNTLMKGLGYSVDVVLETLQNKALITISRDNVVSMHNIIQETAWEIVRQESIENPRSRTRLWDPSDIYQVLKNNKGSEARSIAINLSIIKMLQLNPGVFAKMKKLQYLDVYSKGSPIFSQNQRGLNLSKGLGFLPNKLRYLRWTHYPLESLPSKFSGEKLVILNLQYSRVKKIWNEDKDLVNLKFLILSFSSHLVELPDLSKATNLVEIDLRLCVGLKSVHPSIFSLNKLEKLDLGGCISLTSLPENIHLSSLHYLSLASCRSLKEFSITSKNMVTINLEHAGIKQLPSSIGIQKKLAKLLLAYTYIENLPESIKHLPRLRFLDLRYCRELQSLPELPSSLKILDASGCVSLETVSFPPTTLQQQMENKIRVSFWNCMKLDQQSLKAIGLNAQINIKKFAHQQISKLGHDYNARGTYVYPGSSVPEWIVYRTTLDYMNIDLSFIGLSFSEQLGFIFCFIVPEVASQGSILRFNISVGEGEDIQVYLDRPSRGIKSNHVYLIYDQGFSHYLISRVKDQPKFQIKVTAESRTQTSDYVPLVQLRGFGFSPINTSEYINFSQEMELYGPPNIQNPLLVVFCTFVSIVVMELLL